MRKLILLILAVIVIGHLGFVSYMSADRQAAIAREEIARSAEERSRVSFKPTESAPIADVATAENGEDAAEDAAEAEEVSRVVSRRVNRERSVELSAPARSVEEPFRSRRRASVEPAFPRPQDSAAREAIASGDMETITIYYPTPRKTAPVREERVSTAATAPARKGDRSFVDRVIMPIFKKPYGLIKSIGSRFR